jgi:hypothetical protein
MAQLTDTIYTMNKRINFEDDIFILMLRIRMIRDLVTLNADPELFLEKTLDDICFIDASLKLLLDSLERNNHLIEKDDMLEQLANADSHFSQVLTDFLEHDGSFSVRGFPSIGEKILTYRAKSLERLNTAEKLQPSGEERRADIFVSSDEITELLKAF